MDYSKFKIYISGPIISRDKNYTSYTPNLIDYLIDSGAEILDEHLKCSTEKEMCELIFKKTGIRRDLSPQPWKITFTQDMDWLAKATHLIAFVDYPSLGVGMEIMRALDKKFLGQNNTPVLALANRENENKLSYMVRGIDNKLNDFYLDYYSDFSDVKKSVDKFLIKEY